MEFTFTFIHFFILAIYLVSPLLVLLSVILVCLGLWVSRIEGWTKFDSIYWSFITAMTVGYGDLRPSKKRSKILSIIITFIGFMLFGIIVAITVTTATKAFQKHADINLIQEKKHEQ